MEKAKKVLIVEDEVALLQILGTAFEEAGFLVVKAKDGREGFETALQSHPDIILLDIVMPRVDGVSMYKSLRQDAWGKTVPVILLTNLSDEASIDKSMGDGPHDFLVKAEWTPADVVKRVKEKLGMR